jgi:CHASE2 domain-containing sensor protein/GGDEF domain-containing protein
MSKAGATSGAALFFIFLLAATLSAIGLLKPADQFISDLRYDTRSQPVSGDRVFVAIDAPSLASVGVWPWPRTIHAQIIDALMEAGAHDVVVDIDFSTLSTPDNDAALVAALERAGSYAYLAAFIQPGENGSVDATIPAEPFRALADMVAVNVNEDAAGIARSMPYAIVAGDRAIPSIAGMVTRNRPDGPEVTIDYGIDASTIITLSAIDVIEGRIERDAVAGRTAVVGASALELQDTLRSPNQGVLPGSVVQILAAETVAQQRVIHNPGPVPALLVFAALLSMLAFLSRGWSLAAKWLLAASVAAVAEIAAIAAYHGAAIMVATAPLHGGVLGLLLFYLLNETRVLQFVIDSLRGERDRMRLILKSVVADNFDGIVIIAADWRILSASAFAEGWLGRSLVNADARKVLPTPLVRAVAAGFENAAASRREEYGARDVTIDRPGGPAVAEYVVTVSRPTDGGVSQGESVACLTFRDVTARREHEARLKYLAEHDELTGALARASFVQFVDADLAAGQPVHVLVFNLRRFKSINATLGHQAGDDMLCQVVSRLKDAGYDRTGRLGADTFAVAITQDAVVPDTVFNQIAKIVVEPYRLDGHGATIGIAGGWASGPAGNGATRPFIRGIRGRVGDRPA